MADFPTSIPVFEPVTDDTEQTAVHADLHNRLAEELVAGLTMLDGVDPSRETIVRQARGVIAEPYPLNAASSATVLVDGTVYFGLQGLKKGDVVLSMSVVVTAAGAALTLSKLGLYSVAGALLASTAELGTYWQTAGMRTSNLTAPFIPSSDMAVYGAVVCKGSTLPTMMRLNATNQASTPIASGLPRVHGSQAGQTDLPSSATIGAAGIAFYISTNSVVA
jgi:hypothetical protein